MIKRQMMLANFFFFMLALTMPSASQGAWAKKFNVGTTPLMGVVSPSAGGNYTLVGQLNISDTAEAAFISRHNSSGTPLWAKTISSTGKYSLHGIERSDGSFFIIGSKDLSTTTTRANNIIWAKFNSSWQPVYQKIFGGSRNESLNFWGSTQDGGFIGVGDTNSYGASASDNDVLAIKVKADGNLQWAKAIHYGGADSGIHMVEMSGGGYAVLGYVETAGGGQDILMFKMDANGNIGWKKIFATTDDDWVIGIWQAKNGDLLILGNTETDFDENNMFIIRLTAAGNLVWQKNYTVSDDWVWMSPSNLIENVDGTFIFCGDAYDDLNDYVVLLKLGSAGNIMVQKSLIDGDSLTGILRQSTDGELLFSGDSVDFSSTYSNSDVVYAKINPSTLIPVWAKKFSSPEDGYGDIMDTGSAYFLSGIIFPNASAGMVFGMTLDVNGGYANCSNIKTITLTSGNPGLSVSNANFTQSTPTLISRATGAASNTTLTVTAKTLTEAALCAGATKPIAPANLKVTSVSTTTVSITYGTSNSATFFNIYRKKGTGAFSLIRATNATSITDTTASGNTTTTSYSYYVQACNSAGCSSSTKMAVVPFAPTGASATAGTGKITINWMDKSTNESGFEIWRKPGACTAGGAWTKIATVGKDVKTYTNSGLTIGNVYSYKVRAYTTSAAPVAKGFSSYSNCVNATVK
jgi:hypothetical protein